MIGMPLEERKKAYMGVEMSELVQKYQEAERKRDLPEMLALLDIIKTAPKAPQGPKTTVKDDIMAAAMPAPAPQQGGMDGVLTAMAAQNSPTGQPMMEQAPVMAQQGGVMHDQDEEVGEGYAKGGTLKLFGGGQGTVAPFSNYAALSVEDLQRMVQMGDPEAEKALGERLRANMGYQYRPAAGAGVGVGSNTPQVTDQFRPASSSPMGPAKVFPGQNIPTGTGAVPASPVTPTMGPPQAFPGQNVPKLGVPPTAPAQPTAGIGAMPPNAGPQLPAEPPGGLRGLASRVINSPVTKILNRATGVLQLGMPSTTNVGENDMLAKMRTFQQRSGELSEAQRAEAEKLITMPRVSYQEWSSKFFPGQSPSAAAPAAKDVETALAPTVVAPTLGFNIPASKTAAQYLAEQKAFDEGLEKEGIRSLKDIRKDLEAMGKKGAERAAADRAAAKEAFQQDALLAAGLAAPQLLKGRGLGQAVARYAETVTPGLMGAAQAQKAAIKEANKMERESEDKYKLAGLEMEKAQRAERKGDYKEATAREDKSLQLSVDAAIKKYVADMQHHTYMQYGDKAAVTEGIKAVREELGRIALDPKLKDLSAAEKQAYIDARVRSIMNSVRSAVSGGVASSRPKITNVPG